MLTDAEIHAIADTTTHVKGLGRKAGRTGCELRMDGLTIVTPKQGPTCRQCQPTSANAHGTERANCGVKARPACTAASPQHSRQTITNRRNAMTSQSTTSRTTWVEIGLLEFRSTIRLEAYIARRAADPNWNWRAITGMDG